MGKGIATYITLYNHNKKADTAHCCIHFLDEKDSKNNSLSGVMYVSTILKWYPDCPVFDITDCTNIIGLNPMNIVERGGKQIR